MKHYKMQEIERARREEDSRVCRRINAALAFVALALFAIFLYQAVTLERREAAAYLEGRFELDKESAWTAARDFRVITDNGVVRVVKKEASDAGVAKVGAVRH